MFDNNNQKLQEENSEEFDEEFEEEEFKGFRTIEEIYALEDFDEEDMILANSHFAELKYIIHVLIDIIKNPERRRWKFNRLQDQIRINQQWMKHK